MEKHIGLPIASPEAPLEWREPPARRHSFWRRLFCAAGLTLGLWLLYHAVKIRHEPVTSWCTDYIEEEDAAPRCPQPAALLPSRRSEALDKAYEYTLSEEFANASITRLQGAVRIPTESFDDLGAIGEDPRWDAFFQFADYLKSAYPLIHEKLRLETVNTHGLLYTWRGSDEGLKPILLMAHQDVVPVLPATLDQWTHPPYAAVFDGKYIWGRGANDCKNQLTALMETLELLLHADFSPQRTILLSFGFDEESSGLEGASHLARFILSRYGPGGLEAIVDEGEGYEEAFGRGFATPSVGEKGYVDVDVTVRTRGGHSSIPPDHTGIGILAEVIAGIEARRYEPRLDAANPYLGFLRCGAEHAPEFPEKLRELLDARDESSLSPSSSPVDASLRPHDPLAHEAARLGGPATRYLMQTSQAVDIIGGGVKVNALPEEASALVNHRVNIGETPGTVRARLSALVGPIARAHNLSASLFEDGPARDGAISLRARSTVLDVAPVTPTEVGGAATPYGVLAGTVRAVFGDAPVVAPALSTGNTDTRFYWDLTRHIFRFQPGAIGEYEPDLGNLHTVNERVTAANHVRTVRWFAMFLRNMDEARFGGGG